LRFTPSPQHAWTLGCYLNDRLSIDRRDPATCASLRWACGESAPDRNQTIYGLAPKEFGRALMARPHVAAWVEAAKSVTVPRISVPRWDDVLRLYA